MNQARLCGNNCHGAIRLDIILALRIDSVQPTQPRDRQSTSGCPPHDRAKCIGFIHVKRIKNVCCILYVTVAVASNNIMMIIKVHQTVLSHHDCLIRPAASLKSSKQILIILSIQRAVGRIQISLNRPSKLIP